MRSRRKIRRSKRHLDFIDGLGLCQCAACAVISGKSLEAAPLGHVSGTKAVRIAIAMLSRMTARRVWGSKW